MSITILIQIIDDVPGANGASRKKELIRRSETAKKAFGQYDFQIRTFSNLHEWQRYVEDVKKIVRVNEGRVIWLTFVHGRMASINSFFDQYDKHIAKAYGAQSCNVVTYTGLEGNEMSVSFSQGEASPGAPKWWLAHLNRIYHSGDRMPDVGNIDVSDWVVEAVHRSGEGSGARSKNTRRGKGDSRPDSGPDKQILPTTSVRDVHHILNNVIVPFSINLSRALERETGDLSAIESDLPEVERALCDSRDKAPDYLRREIDALRQRVQSFDKTPSSGYHLLDALNCLSSTLNGLTQPRIPDASTIRNLRRALKGRSIKILWIEDDLRWAESFGKLLADCGIAVDFVHDPLLFQKYRAQLSEYDAIIVDLTLFGWCDVIRECLEAEHLPHDDINEVNAGLGLLRALRSFAPTTPAYVLSAHQSPQLIVQSIHEGADDYFAKGGLEVSRLVLALNRDIESASDARKAREKPQNPNLFVGIDRDPLANEIAKLSELRWELISQPVYLWGEPGVGKEEFAVELQRRSHRGSRPFKVLPCSEIAETLVESAVRGHAKGAFTGASESIEGPLEEAKNGVLFVDEIDKAPERVLDVLLRPLEARQVSRLGGKATSRVDALIIFAGNVPPQELRHSSFSSRLGPVYRIPALRERIEALPCLAQFMVDRLCAELNRGRVILKPDAVTWLEARTLSGAFDGEGGNVRGLRNLLQDTLCLRSVELTIGSRELARVAGHRTLEYLDEPKLERALLKAAATVADCLTRSHQPVQHKDLEDQFMSALVHVLKERRYSREAVEGLLFDKLGRTNLDKKIAKLREKGFLPENFTWGSKKRRTLSE